MFKTLFLGASSNVEKENTHYQGLPENVQNPFFRVEIEITHYQGLPESKKKKNLKRRMREKKPDITSILRLQSTEQAGKNCSL
jgi:hypothetical protein